MSDARLSSEAMPHRRIRLISCAILGAAFANGATQLLWAQPKPEPYPNPAPLSQYLIPDKASEIELARSAAPSSISGAAEVLVLGRDGYTTAVKGTDGFTCLVERAWANQTDDPQFWNPRMRAPICVNAPAAKTYLPIVLMKTKLVLAGRSKSEIGREVKAALAAGKLPALEPNAMSYMMSKRQYLNDGDTHWQPHLMWFVPGDAAKLWGGNLPGSPTFAANAPEDSMTVFMLGVDHWSDGTLAHGAH